MKIPELIGCILGVLTIATLAILFQAWILGIILSWFNVHLTIWQNSLIVVLANMIFTSTRSSSK